jgi:hypothetical protein
MKKLILLLSTLCWFYTASAQTNNTGDLLYIPSVPQIITATQPPPASLSNSSGVQTITPYIQNIPETQAIEPGIGVPETGTQTIPGIQAPTPNIQVLPDTVTPYINSKGVQNVLTPGTPPRKRV